MIQSFVVSFGFVLPTNELAFRNMGEGWKKCVPKIGAVAAEPAPAKKRH